MTDRDLAPVPGFEPVGGFGEPDDSDLRFLPLAEFVSAEDPSPPEAHLGTSEENISAAGGLTIIGGEGGAGKTTLVTDGTAHLASGTPWLGHPVARPVRVLLIENEGPRALFRQKLDRKLSTWTGASWRDNVYVFDVPWASFTFANVAHREALRSFTRDHGIDLVICDPLDALGIAGSGKPEETREFVRWLRDCGLHDPAEPVAFWILHHYSKNPQRTVVQALSGAWGGHPDTILGVEADGKHRTKVTWAKTRWATPPGEPTILEWDLNTRGFTVVATDRDGDTDAEDERAAEWIIAHVADYPGLARSKVEDAYHQAHGGGRNRARRAVDLCLKGQQSPETGGESPPRLATGLGENPRATYLYPASQADSPLATTLSGESGESLLNHLGKRRLADSPLPRRGGESKAASLDSVSKPTTVNAPAPPSADGEAFFGDAATVAPVEDEAPDADEIERLAALSLSSQSDAVPDRPRVRQRERRA